MVNVNTAWSSVCQHVAFYWDLCLRSGLPLIFWVQPRFSVTDMTDQSGKVILITGANSGTGLASARALYGAGAKVYLACRNPTKAQEAISSIESRWSNSRSATATGELVFLQMDLSDLKSVRQAAEEFMKYAEEEAFADCRKEKVLNILMCNAGIMATAEGQYTAQKYTLQFGVNVLGHQALLQHLLPTLLSTSRSNPSDPARVLTLSSAGHASAPRGGVDYQSVTTPGRELSKWPEYGQAKWGDIALSRYLHAVYGPGARLTSRRKAEGELLCFSMHPGMVATNLAGHLSGAAFVRKYMSFIAHLVVRPPDVGAGNQLWLASMSTEQARSMAGEYIVPFQRVGRPRPDVLVEANVVRMWDWCEAQVQKHE